MWKKLLAKFSINDKQIDNSALYRTEPEKNTPPYSYHNGWQWSLGAKTRTASDI